MKFLNKLTKTQKIIFAVIVAVFLAFSFIKTYFPSLLGLSTWNSNINLVASGKLNDAENKSLSVHFIDVGQGDCTLIKTDNGNMLIDTGNSIDGDNICKYLLSHNVRSVDYLVITHPHSDHYGGAVRILDLIEVKNVLMPEIDEKYYKDDEDYIFLLNKISKMKIPVFAARAGDIYKLGEAVFTVLSPISENENVNEMSAVIRLDYKDTSFIFMGDAESITEKNLLDSKFNLECDVLKIGHHGSPNASGKEFLKAVHPFVSVISCGYDNEYGHPGENVLYSLKKLDSAILRTDLNGDIVIGSDGEKLYCWFEKGKRY